MTVVLDAGTFAAVERDDRNLIAIVKREWLAQQGPLTGGWVVGQLWHRRHGH